MILLLWSPSTRNCHQVVPRQPIRKHTHTHAETEVSETVYLSVVISVPQLSTASDALKSTLFKSKQTSITSYIHVHVILCAIVIHLSMVFQIEIINQTHFSAILCIKQEINDHELRKILKY